jgi:hypothetical protein
MSGSEFIVVLPDEEPFKTLAFPTNATVIYSKTRPWLAKDLDRLRELYVDVPALLRRRTASLVFSMGDLARAF